MIEGIDVCKDCILREDVLKMINEKLKIEYTDDLEDLKQKIMDSQHEEFYNKNKMYPKAIKELAERVTKPVTDLSSKDVCECGHEEYKHEGGCYRLYWNKQLCPCKKFKSKGDVKR